MPPATVSDTQCLRPAIRPAEPSAATPYSHGASYSLANGVTAAKAIAEWVDGKEASDRLFPLPTPDQGPRSSSGRARPIAYLPTKARPVAAATDCMEIKPVFSIRSSPNASAAPAAPTSAYGMALPSLSQLRKELEFSCFLTKRSTGLSASAEATTTP